MTLPIHRHYQSVLLSRPCNSVLTLALGWLFTLVASIAQAQVTTIDIPGSTATWMYDINDGGDSIGLWTDDEYGMHSFKRSASGQITNISYTGAIWTIAQGINKAGVVVGVYYIETPEYYWEMHGFKWFNGTFTNLTCSGASESGAYDINNLGVIVGECRTADPFTQTAVIWSGTSVQTFNLPQAVNGLGIMSLTDGGVLAGFYGDANSVAHGFLYDHGVVEEIGCAYGGQCDIWKVAGENDFAAYVWGPYSGGPLSSIIRRGGKVREYTLPGTVGPVANALNSTGFVAGYYYRTDTGKQVGFIASEPTLLDPIPDLVDGNAITSNGNLLAEQGRIVQGVAADGVARVLLRLPALTANQEFTVRVLDDSDPPLPAYSVSIDGGVSALSGQATPELTATAEAVSTSNGPFAFFVYVAPKDFSRGIPDDDLARRVVHLEITTPGAGAYLLDVEVIRPPVVLVHGLWDSWTAWNTFAPLVQGPSNVDPRFSVGRANYDNYVGHFNNSEPWDNLPISSRRLRSNSLGLEFNARSVASQVQAWIDAVRLGSNPPGFAVAAAQADIVAHSMGGLISRTMTTMDGFESVSSFGHGNVHKLITVDTPHLGTPIARGLGLSNYNSCVRKVLGSRGRHAYRTFTLMDGRTVGGAIGDMSDDALNPALLRIAGSLATPIAMSTVAGIYQAWSGIGSSLASIYFYAICSGSPGITNIGRSLDETNWPALFGDAPNDGLVSIDSQSNGSSLTASVFEGYVHSRGTAELGFELPSVLDSAQVAEHVISLLNTWTAFVMVP